MTLKTVVFYLIRNVCNVVLNYTNERYDSECVSQKRILGNNILLMKMFLFNDIYGQFRRFLIKFWSDQNITP